MTDILIIAVLVIVALHFAYDLGWLGELWRWIKLDLRPHIRMKKRIRRIKKHGNSN